MEKTFTKEGNNFFKIVTALIITVFLMLAVKKVAAHKVLYYTPTCFTQGSTVNIATKITYALPGTYYHWQYRNTAGGSWVWLANGNNTINGRVFNVANASLQSTVNNYTPDLIINNVGTPSYTVQLNNVELRVIMTDGLDPQYNSFPGTAAWGGEEFYSPFEAKYIRLHAKPATESCNSNCTGNVLVSNPAVTAPALFDYFGGFEMGYATTDDNFCVPGIHGTTSKAASDVVKWATGSMATTPMYRIVNNADSMNSAFTAFAPHSGRNMMVISRNNNSTNRLWYRTVMVSNAASFYNGQITLKAWFAKLDVVNPCMAIEVKGATNQAGAVSSFSGNSISTSISGNTGEWVQLTLSLTLPANTYKKLEFSIRNCNSNISSVAIDDICLIEPAASVLPVDLLPLQAKYADGITYLTWGTLQESNSSHFEVEHSTNGYDFTAVGKVTANGISSLKTNYAFNHIKAVAGNNYYRLRQIDRNGLFVYSNILTINIVIKGTFITGIYPSPFIDRVSVTISSENAKQATIRLLDIMGRQIVRQNSTVNKGLNTITLNNVGNLGKGVYILEVNCGGILHSERMLK